MPRSLVVPKSLLPSLGCLAALLLLGGASACASDDLDAAPINYHTAESNDAVAKLQRAIDAGEVKLEWDEKWGWLPAVLDRLDIPEQSQTLVFSKTSLQVHKISPRRPRALYYNERAYVGYVQRGDVLEVIAIDPVNGPVFYTLGQDEAEHPRFLRDKGRCLSCHHSRRTQQVPGLLVRSVYPDDRGHPLSHLGGGVTDPTTPFEDRYGGWYVTGGGPATQHRGNALYNEPDERSAERPEPKALVVDRAFRSSHYLTPHSDLVAIMLLEHQSQMHNAITRASYEGRRADSYNKTWGKLLEKPADYEFEVSVKRLDQAAEDLIECLLFCGEAVLPEDFTCQSPFAASFQQAGRRDSQGRSLHDLDLRTRLLKYPCSYLVYSESFAALPKPILERVSHRLKAVLAGEDTSARFSHLSQSDREAIREILVATNAPVSL